jgi:hypothetical protein
LLDANVVVACVESCYTHRKPSITRRLPGVGPQILRRPRSAAAPTNSIAIASSIQRLSTGVGTAAEGPPPGDTATTACDVHGGAEPDGAQTLAAGEVTFATLTMLDGGFAESTAVTV